jgi:hypothetical protein
MPITCYEMVKLLSIICYESVIMNEMFLIAFVLITYCEICICNRRMRQCREEECIWLWGRGRTLEISAEETFA